MNNLDIAKGLIFEGLNTIKKETLADRVIIQKKIYLLQERGVDLGYSYNWYLKGPYSPSLTEYVYDKLDELASADLGEYSLNEGVLAEIDAINSLEKKSPTNLSPDQWYELLASIHYIRENFFPSNDEGVNEEKVIQNLIKRKPQYTESDCSAALAALRSVDF